MKTIIYHNNRCKKSREALELLREKTNQLTVIEYLKYPLTTSELTHIVDQLNIQPLELVRKNESVWKEEYKGKNLTHQEIVQAMVNHPKLIERPIVINEKGAVIGRPASKVLEIL